MTPNPTHESQVVTLSVRERLVQIRAEKAFGRAPAWLGAGKGWMAFAPEGCACGCGGAQARSPGGRAHRQ